jgi:hypothetical protein
METSTELNQSNFSVAHHALRWGVIIGVIGLLIGIIFYVIDVGMWGNWKIGIVMLLVTLGLVIYAGLQCRRDVGGFLSFKDGWLHGFIVFAIAGFISTLFQIVMFNVIDPGAVDIIVEKTVENTIGMMESFGAPEDQMDEALERTEEQVIKRFTVGGALQGFGWALVFYAVLALITGAISMKKNKELSAL